MRRGLEWPVSAEVAPTHDGDLRRNPSGSFHSLGVARMRTDFSDGPPQPAAGRTSTFSPVAILP